MENGTNLRSQQQAATSFTDCLVKSSIGTSYTGSHEAKAQAEQHIRQDGTEDCTLDQGDLVVSEKYHEQDDLDNRRNPNEGLPLAK